MEGETSMKLRARKQTKVCDELINQMPLAVICEKGRA